MAIRSKENYTHVEENRAVKRTIYHYVYKKRVKQITKRSGRKQELKFEHHTAMIRKVEKPNMRYRCQQTSNQ